MIQVGVNPVLRTPSQSILINDMNKPQLAASITYQYQRHYTKNCLTYELTYKALKQLSYGIFNKDLISEVFHSIKNKQISLCFAKKYIEDVRELLEEGSEQSYSSLPEQEVLNDSDIDLSRRCLEVQSNYERSVKCLGDELSICSDHQIFMSDTLLQISSPIPHKRSLEIDHPIDISITVSPASPVEIIIPIPILPQPKSNGESQISTYSDHSLTKSCMITAKDKEFLIKPVEIKKQKVDYKKQYERKIHGALVQNAMSLYRSSKKK